MSKQRDKIAAGKLARWGVYGEVQIDAACALLHAGAALDTIRVVFPDQHGILRGKTLVGSALASVLAEGIAVPSTLVLKDTSHRTVFPVWDAPESVPFGLGGAGDLLLVPDLDALHPVPWEPGAAWLICTAHQADGRALPVASQTVLGDALGKLAEQGLSLTVGLEVEFHIFERLDPALNHAQATMPGAPVATRNLAQGYQFLTDQRYDTLSPILDKLREACQQMGLPLRSMEVEMGPSQVEFTFDPADPMTHARNMVLFRTMVKELCAREGLHASFMTRPRLENAAANGWHVHQSLSDVGGNNLMMPAGGMSPQAAGWIAGLLEHANAACMITTPTVNGYKRYQPHQLAPDRVQWGRDNRGAMLRALMSPGDPASRIENRAPEPVANPYHVFAAQILCGLDGIARGLVPPAPIERPYDSTAPKLPTDLGSAIAAFEASETLRSSFGDEVHSYLVTLRRAEWQRYLAAISEWEQAEYFNLF